MEGARRPEDLARRAREGDLVVACFTGGSSALACLPPDEVTFDEQRRLHELLLGAGMPISAVNTVRKHVSNLKGGRLAADIAPARIINLAISDVAGDVLDLLTDPSVQDTSTALDVDAVINAYGLRAQSPASIIHHV